MRKGHTMEQNFPQSRSNNTLMGLLTYRRILFLLAAVEKLMEEIINLLPVCEGELKLKSRPLSICEESPDPEDYYHDQSLINDCRRFNRAVLRLSGIISETLITFDVNKNYTETIKDLETRYAKIVKLAKRIKRKSEKFE